VKTILILLLWTNLACAGMNFSMGGNPINKNTANYEQIKLLQKKADKLRKYMSIINPDDGQIKEIYETELEIIRITDGLLKPSSSPITSDIIPRFADEESAQVYGLNRKGDRGTLAILYLMLAFYENREIELRRSNYVHTTAQKQYDMHKAQEQAHYYRIAIRAATSSPIDFVTLTSEEMAIEYGRKHLRDTDEIKKISNFIVSGMRRHKMVRQDMDVLGRYDPDHAARFEDLYYMTRIIYYYTLAYNEMVYGGFGGGPDMSSSPVGSIVRSYSVPVKEGK
jgi:hypothetical protein